MTYYILSVNCEWSSWSSFSPCTKTCGGGTRHETRHITSTENLEKYGGTCSGTFERTKDCNTKSCASNF